jgi:DNA-binding YbaB/EbfC family protein
VNINPFDILKNAQKIQEQMGSMQEKLASISETGSAGGGMVEVELSGKMEVLRVRVKEAVVDPQDIAMLQDLVAAAMNQALDKVKDRVQREIGAMAGGMGLVSPPGFFGGGTS